MKRQLFNLTISLTLTALSSCGDSPKQTVNPFKQFISRLTVLNNFSYSSTNQDTEKCYSPTDKDSLFCDLRFEKPLIFGLLPDTSDNYKILYLHSRPEGSSVSLKTFDQNGLTIDDQNVYNDVCAGWDCGLDSCEWYIKLLDKQTIESYRKMTVTECDSIGNEIPSTNGTVIHRQTIWVDTNGKIIYGKEQDK